MGSNTKLCKACVEDRISALPDAVLCHILSFLVTRDAVQTCLVSHRWNNVWTSVPNLQVSVSSKYDLDEHVRHAGLVDRVLLFRSLSNIYKFRLVCFGIEDYFDRIDAWVCTAIRRSVVELELDLYTTPSSSHTGCLKLPTSLFICSTLVVLKLVLTDHVTAIPPNSSCFLSLKYLDVFVHYPAVAVDSVAKLFSCSYPALEHLNIHGNLGRVEDDEVLNLNICAPKLKRLRIGFCAVPEDDPYATDGGYEYKIFVNANVPNLGKFDVKYLLASYSLKNAKSLSTVEIKFKGLHAGENLYFADRIHRLFAEIVNVKYLSILASILGDPDIAYRYPMPTFNNLNQLKLRLQTCCSWRSLTIFLNASPNLEYLVLENNINCRAHGAHIDEPDDPDDIDDYDSDDYDEDDLVHEWYPPEVVPISLLSCLKTVYIRGFRGRIDEIEVAEYLLKHGKVLNKVTICTSNFCQESVMELWQIFSRLPRGSKTCEIEWILPKL